MQTKTKLIIAGSVVVAVVAGGTGIAAATGAGGEQRLEGSTRDQAVAAALAHTGGGTVTETEQGDNGAAYGVEVRLPAGGQVEVSLDKGFGVIGQESDEDRAGEGENSR